MKRKLLLFILLITPFLGYGQLSVGLAGGYTHNWLDADAGYYDREYSSEGGYSLAIPVEYSFNDWFALRSELGYMTKSYRWDRIYAKYEDYFVVAEHEEYKNGYLSVPVMANFSCGGERLRAFVNGGAWVGAWLNGEVSGMNDEFFNGIELDVCGKYEFDTRRDNRFDAGLLCGIGAEYMATPLVGVFVEGRYMYGLTDMQKSYLGSYPRYNSTVLVQLGVTYSFNLK